MMSNRHKISPVVQVFYLIVFKKDREKNKINIITNCMELFYKSFSNQNATVINKALINRDI